MFTKACLGRGFSLGLPFSRQFGKALDLKGKGSEAAASLSSQQQKMATSKLAVSELKAPADFSVPSLVASCNPPSAFKDRVAYIYQPSRSVMQAGLQASKRWVIDFNPDVGRWDNRLMGWASSRDPMQALRLEFDTCEGAIFYAKEQGWAFEVTGKQKSRDVKAKSYSDNFLYSPGKLKLIKTK